MVPGEPARPRGRPLITGSLRLRPAALPLVGAALALAWVAITLLGRADALLSTGYDQAIFEQVVWNFGRGQGFSSGFWPADYLGLHFSPLLALPAFLELGWGDARLLSLLHAAGLAASAPAGFLLFRALLPAVPRAGWAAAVLAAPLPFWAEMQEAAASDFHPEALALPAVLLTAWAGLRGRWRIAWLCALLALAAKEDQAYPVAAAGVLLLRHGPAPGQAMALMAAAAGWAAGAFLVAMPLFRAGHGTQLANYYSWLPAAGPGEIAAALGRPEAWLAAGGLLASACLLPLLRPPWLLLVAPPLIADMLSAHYPQNRLGLHYGLLLMAPILFATALGARRALVSGWPRTALAALVLPPVLVGLALGPLPPARGPVERPLQAAPGLARLLRCTAQLPPTAPAAADDSAAAPLAARRRLRLLPDAEPQMYVVVDREGYVPSYIDRAQRSRVLESLPGSRRRLCDDGRFQLWAPATEPGRVPGPA